MVIGFRKLVRVAILTDGAEDTGTPDAATLMNEKANNSNPRQVPHPGGAMETTKTLERSLASSHLHRSKPGVGQVMTMLLAGTIRPRQLCGSI